MAKQKKSLALAWILRWVAAVIYMTGLGFLIPLLILLLYPPQIFILPPNTGKLTLIASALVGISAIILMLQKKSIGDALVSLSILTFLIGIIATVFAFFGQENIISFLGFLGALKPAAEGYIAYWASFVPQVWISITGYIVIGLILWIIGNHIRREQHKISWIQKVFGKRVQIFK